MKHAAPVKLCRRACAVLTNRLLALLLKNLAALCSHPPSLLPPAPCALQVDVHALLLDRAALASTVPSVALARRQPHTLLAGRFCWWPPSQRAWYLLAFWYLSTCEVASVCRQYCLLLVVGLSHAPFCFGTLNLPWLQDIIIVIALSRLHHKWSPGVMNCCLLLCLLAYVPLMQCSVRFGACALGGWAARRQLHVPVAGFCCRVRQPMDPQVVSKGVLVDVVLQFCYYENASCVCGCIPLA